MSGGRRKTYRDIQIISVYSDYASTSATSQSNLVPRSDGFVIIYLGDEFRGDSRPLTGSYSLLYAL